jgi:hypothetical protein
MAQSLRLRPRVLHSPAVLYAIMRKVIGSKRMGGHWKPMHEKMSTPTTEREGALKVNNLPPSFTISVDHFDFRQEGRTSYSPDKACSWVYRRNTRAMSR